MHTKALITALLIAASPLATLGSVAASGTANPHASCGAQLIPTEGTPGSSVPTIKIYITPVPGHLISVVARMDKSACELPS